MQRSKEAAFAAASFALPLALYLFSLDGDVGFWDTGEMQTVPYIAGIAHPTGYPTFTMLGWLFTHAVPLGSVAWRTTFMCALCYAFASLFRRLNVDPNPTKDAKLWIVTAASAHS